MAKRGETFEPTPDERFMVHTLTSHGISHSVICSMIRRREGGITEKTLRKHFRAQLDGGREVVKATLIVSLIRAGNSGNVAAIKYWLALFGGPEFKLQSGDADIPAGVAAGTTTIVIHGGLPTITHTMDEDDEDDAAPVNGHGTNGHSNGTNRPD